MTSLPFIRVVRQQLARAIIGVGLLAPWAAQAEPTQPNQLVNPISAPQTCELCHGYFNALSHSGDLDYSPQRSWQGTLMANSARDPVFWAGLAVADADAPGQTEICVRCHAPRAFLEGNGAATSIDELTLDQQEGVECDFCHRAIDDGITPVGNAQYSIDDTLIDGINVARRGPWSYDDGVPEPPHYWVADPYIGSSQMCGTCHDVTTSSERVDDDGHGLGVPFNEQRTYREWLGSAYADPGPQFRSCQDCHLPEVADKPGCTAHLNQYSHPTGGRRHDLVGANRFMVQLLRQEYGSAGANLLADLFFDNTLEAIDAFVPTSATLEVQAPDEIDLAEGLSNINVTVTNQTGHKLPSGYSEGRVMWLEVTAHYGEQLVYSSGAWDQTTGMQQDAQLRTYQALAERWSDNVSFHLLLNNHWVEDTRIPPLGMTPDLETDPVGDRYQLLPDNTWPNYDQHSYHFEAATEIEDHTPQDTGDDQLVLTLRLLYLINSPEYIDFLAAEAGEAGNHVATLFELAGGAPPITLAEQTLTIPIVGFSEPPTVATGTVDSTGTTTASADSTSTSTTPTSGTDTHSDSTTASPGTQSTTAEPNPIPADTMLTGDPATSESESGSPSLEPDGGGCGCRTGTPAPANLAWLPWLWLGLRRRRYTSPPMNRP